MKIMGEPQAGQRKVGEAESDSAEVSAAVGEGSMASRFCRVVKVERWLGAKKPK